MSPSFSPELPESVRAIDRPSPTLWRYYLIRSLLFGPFFFVPLIFLWLRFRTLRYRFDEEGVAMRWGALFRREVALAYERIQDIHLVSNVIERRLGLARIKIQTASGSAKAEMTIEGVPEFEQLRDHLYARMQGQQQPGETVSNRDRQVVAELGRATAELREIGRLLASGRAPDDD